MQDSIMIDIDSCGRALIEELKLGAALRWRKRDFFKSNYDDYYYLIIRGVKWDGKWKRKEAAADRF